jgi:hypothetical protein
MSGIPYAILWGVFELLGLLDQPARSKPRIISVKEVHRYQEVLIVVQLCVSLEDLIGFLFHLSQLMRWINNLLFVFLNGWEVLVRPWTSKAVSEHVVFAFKERLSFSLIIAEICVRKMKMIKSTSGFTYQLVGLSFVGHRTSSLRRQ